jgi:hypothetical protein
MRLFSFSLLACSCTLLIAGPAAAESAPGAKTRKRTKKVVKSHRESRKVVGEEDRRLMPEPWIGPKDEAAAEVQVAGVDWDPMRPRATSRIVLSSGAKSGLMVGDRLSVLRGTLARPVGELVIESVSAERAIARVVRLVDPSRSPVLEHLAVMTGDRVSMIEVVPEAAWTPKKKKPAKRRRRRRAPKAGGSSSAPNLALPPGKSTISVGGRELPNKNPAFSITPAASAAPTKPAAKAK